MKIEGAKKSMLQNPHGSTTRYIVDKCFRKSTTDHRCLIYVGLLAVSVSVFIFY